MATTKTQTPTPIDFLEFPYDIRCIIYSFVDLSFHAPTHQNWFSNDLVAYTTGAPTGVPILDCSATIRAEAFPYVVKQNSTTLQESTMLPFTGPSCTAIINYLKRTDNLDVFYHTIDDAHFDMRKSSDPAALAVLEKCKSLSCVVLSIDIDEVDTSAPQIIPDELKKVLVELPDMYCVILEILDSRDGAMRTLEELVSGDVAGKWEYLERHADIDLKVCSSFPPDLSQSDLPILQALVKLADANEERIHWRREDGSLEFAESWTADKGTRTWKTKCYLKPCPSLFDDVSEDDAEDWETTDPEDFFFRDAFDDVFNWSDDENDAAEGYCEHQ